MKENCQEVSRKEIFIISLYDCRYWGTDNGVERYGEPHTLVTDKKSRADKIIKIAIAYDIHYSVHKISVWTDHKIFINSEIGKYTYNSLFGRHETYNENEQHFVC